MSEEWDLARLGKEQRGDGQPPHGHVVRHERTRRLRPLRVFWFVVSAVVVVFVLTLFLDPGKEPGGDGRSTADARAVDTSTLARSHTVSDSVSALPGL